jgi:maltose O-acetyltransferase
MGMELGEQQKFLWEVIMTKWQRLLMQWRSLLIPPGPLGDRARGKLYETFLKRCGSNFKVAHQAFIYSPESLTVGDHVYIGFGSYIGNGTVTLHDEVLIGNHVSITAANHEAKNGSYRFGGSSYDPVVIGRGCWIGGHACILAGVTLGKGCLVAAGAVVTKSQGDHLVLGGVPARVLGEAPTGQQAGGQA